MQAMQSLNKKMDKQNGESNVEQNHHDYQNRVGALLNEKKKRKVNICLYSVHFTKNKCYVAMLLELESLK